MRPGDILTMFTNIICERYQGRTRHERTYVHLDPRDGVERRGLSYSEFLSRDDDKGSAFERHRGRVPFDIAKHNSIPSNFS